MDSIFLTALTASLKVKGVFIGQHGDYNRNQDRGSPLIGSYFLEVLMLEKLNMIRKNGIVMYETRFDGRQDIFLVCR